MSDQLVRQVRAVIEDEFDTALQGVWAEYPEWCKIGRDAAADAVLNVISRWLEAYADDQTSKGWAGDAAEVRRAARAMLERGDG